MSIICGVFALKRGASVPSEWIQSMSARISRNGLGRVSEFRSTGVYLAQLNLGAFGDDVASIIGSEGATVVSGDPVLPDRPVRGRRDSDVALLASVGPSSILQGWSLSVAL